MAKTHVTIPVFIPHLGCGHRCIFCNQWESTSAEQIPDPSNISRLIREYMKNIRSGISRVELAFFGGSFTGISTDLQEAYLKEAHRHLAEGTIRGIRLSTRPDYISEESLRLLDQYGVSTIELGVQSFDDAVLETAHRGHCSADTRLAIRLIKRHGFDLVIQLMPGLPGETRDSALETARETASLKPSAVRIYPAVVLKNTRLETMFLSGIFRPLTLEDAIEICKEIYEIMSARMIPVIRMGIHPLSPDNRKTIVAGPYHPAFGYLVKSRIKRDTMASFITEYLRNAGPEHAPRMHMLIPDLCAEEYIGNRKENIRHLEQMFGINRLDYSIAAISDISIRAQF